MEVAAITEQLLFGLPPRKQPPEDPAPAAATRGPGAPRPPEPTNS